MTSPFLSRLAAWASEEKLHNWAGNVEYGTDRVYPATSVEEVQEFCPHPKQAEGIGHAPLFQSHCRQPRSISFDESDGQDGGTERGSADSHDRVRNELREVVPDSGGQRLGAAQFGVIAAHFRGGRMLDGYTRLRREERQLSTASFGAGDRERGGRRW